MGNGDAASGFWRRASPTIRPSPSGPPATSAWRRAPAGNGNSANGVITDVREGLGVIAAPTLASSRARGSTGRSRASILAESIPDAELVEPDGSDDYRRADAAPVLAEIEEFFTGVHRIPARIGVRNGAVHGHR